MKIKFDGKEYDPNNLSELAVSAVVSLQFISTRLTELKNMQALLKLTRATCIEKIKEILSEKLVLFWVITKKGMKMPKITIDDVEFNSEDLSDNGKAQLASLQFLDADEKLQAEIAVYQTARNSYVSLLKNELEPG